MKSLEEIPIDELLYHTDLTAKYKLATFTEKCELILKACNLYSIFINKT